VGNDEDRSRSRRLGAEDRGLSGTSPVLGDSTIGSSGDTVSDSHCTRGGDEKREFTDLASKLVVTICQWFGLKTTTTISWFVTPNYG
jgi:hypothetical protein